MADKQSTKPVQSAPSALLHSQTVSLIAEVPLVAGAVDYALSVIKGNPLLYRSYLLGENVFVKSLQITEPITSRFSTPLAAADGLAAYTLRLAKSKVPYPFEVRWEDLISFASTPVNSANEIVSNYRTNAQSLYDTHVKDNAKSVYEQTGKVVEQLQQNENKYLQKAGNSIAAISDSLVSITTDYANKAKEDVGDGEVKAQGLVKNLYAELDNLHKFTLSLPNEGQKRLAPVVETISSTYKEISIDALDSSLPIQERITKITNYLKQETIPSLHSVRVRTRHY